MVGMVVTISPSLSLYKIVVLPAASRPTEISRIKNKFSEKYIQSIVFPIASHDFGSLVLNYSLCWLVTKFNFDYLYISFFWSAPL